MNRYKTDRDLADDIEILIGYFFDKFVIPVLIIMIIAIAVYQFAVAVGGP